MNKVDYVVSQYEIKNGSYLSPWKVKNDLKLTKECALGVMKIGHQNGSMHPVGLWIVTLKPLKQK